MGRQRARNGGFTLLEVMVSISILAIGTLGIIAALSTEIVGAGTSEDMRLCMEGIRNKIEDMRATPFSVTGSANNFFDTYNTQTFTIPGLRVPVGVATMGSVSFLSESAAKTAFATSGTTSVVDLDWDGVYDETTTPIGGWKSYAIQISVTFGDRTRNQNQTMTVTTIIVDDS